MGEGPKTGTKTPNEREIGSKFRAGFAM